jgi:glycosyltransferase involved in cell wall biosynthesis
VPIRVAHCVHGLGLGGAQKVIASIVRGTDPKTFRHFVYSCDDGVHREEVEHAGASVRIIPRWIPKLDPIWAVRLARAMRTDAIDLVHTHLFGDSLHGYLASLAAGRPPVVMTLHIGTEGLWGLQPWGYRRLLARCARAVACSESVRRSFEAVRDDAFPSPVVIPNGITLPPADASAADPGAVRRELGADGDELLLATIGRLAEQKGHRYLLSAVASLVRTRGVAARLVVLGDGPLRGELERQAHAEGIADRVSFAGIRPDVLRLLGAIDAVVFSSLFEGLPVALLEAMATARCIVGTDAPGIVEAVRPDREALIVPTRDAEALAEALYRVASDRALARRLGEAARRRFLAEFTAERMAERYQALYRDVHAARSGPSASRASR